MEMNIKWIYTVHK